LSHALLVLSFDAGKGRLWSRGRSSWGCDGSSLVWIVWIGFQSLLSMSIEATHDHASTRDVVFVVSPEDGTAVLSNFDLSIRETLEYGLARRTAIPLSIHLSAVCLEENIEPHWGISAGRDPDVFECSADMVEKAGTVTSMFADVDDHIICILLIDSLGRATYCNEAWKDEVKVRLDMSFQVLHDVVKSSAGLTGQCGSLSTGSLQRTVSLCQRMANDNEDCAQ
jgi:hypothetical protein